MTSMTTNQLPNTYLKLTMKTIEECQLADFVLLSLLLTLTRHSPKGKKSHSKSWSEKLHLSSALPIFLIHIDLTKSLHKNINH